MVGFLRARGTTLVVGIGMLVAISAGADAGTATGDRPSPNRVTDGAPARVVEALPAPLQRVAPASPAGAAARPDQRVVLRSARIDRTTYAVPAPIAASAVTSALTASGIPTTALDAYRRAAARERTRRPACGITWPLLAGIGRVESNHGRFAGAVLHTDGISTPRIIGIPLDGHGTALIRDTDGGRLDGDTVYDRAVGPMQFIPSTWAGWGVDADHNGTANPFDIFDAAAAAADYLCATGNLTTFAAQVRAVRSYNDSDSYIRMVLGLERAYAVGAVGVTIPLMPTDPSPARVGPTRRPHLPPVDPGHPRGLPASGTHRPVPKHPATHPTKTPVQAPSQTPNDSPAPSVSTSAPSPTGTPASPTDPSSTCAPASSTSAAPTTGAPTSDAPSSDAPTSDAPTSDAPSSDAPTSPAPSSTDASSSAGPTSPAPSTSDAPGPGC